MLLGIHTVVIRLKTELIQFKAMLLTSLVLLGGFAILIASDFGGTFNTGLFSGLTIFFALVGDLVVLPILVRMIWRDEIV